jgi:aryl-alcohol dehydrogenase-like predicted oxidoreductase
MAVPRYELAPDFSICRILNGMWQVSGAHGAIDPEAAVEAMFAYHDAGYTTWDLADHYGPAEDLVGEFRRRLKKDRPGASFEALTKWVPQPGPATEAAVSRAIERSLRRMDVDQLDVLQFHWWEYDDEAYLDALTYLAKLQEQGLIRHLALTNFDTEHMKRITDHGVRIVSNQVQYSLIDMRPAAKMEAYCLENDIALLTYGTLAGGLLSERFLGVPEPTRFHLDTASLRKYKQMIDAWGGWSLFQELLATLDRLADAKGVTIANLAVRYVLDQPAVGGVIVGVRLGLAEHIAENGRVFEMALSTEERAEMDAVLSRGADLMRLIGDCGDEYRR